MRYGVIDLGTNTFHLLLVEHRNNEIFLLYKKRIFVQLAEDGIQTISDKAIARALNALSEFQKKLDFYQVKNLKAIGTEGLRRASNSLLFQETVKSMFDIDIEVVSGMAEAEFIYRGVLSAIPETEEKFVVMDIGGGSVEFIIGDSHNKLWSDSYKVGIAVLFEKFHKSDPISPEEISDVKQFLDEELSELKTELEKHQVKTLIGAAGAFDVVAEFIGEKESNSYSSVDMSSYSDLYKRYVHSSVAEREGMKELPSQRIQLISVATLLIDYMVRECKLTECVVSNYAMKEGILYYMLAGKSYDSG